jgi:F-type H+-transporting ATPase subunit b
VRQLLDEGRRAAQRQHDEMMAQARAEIQGERDRLHREINMARDQALQQLWAQAADLATLVSSKAIRRHLTPDDHRRLVDEALAELRQTKRNGDGARAGR